MKFYTMADLANGTNKKMGKPVVTEQIHGGTLRDTYEELSITPQITKRKQIKKLNEIEEPTSTKDKLKVFIDFNFK